MQRTWSSYLARPATSDRGAADLKASPQPPATFDSCGLAGCWLAGLLAGWLSDWLAAGLLSAHFDWQDMQDWQGAGPK